jgi:hypothetical protein
MKSGTTKKTVSSAVPASEKHTHTPPDSRQTANQTILSTYQDSQQQQQQQPESVHPPASSTSQRSELVRKLPFAYILFFLTLFILHESQLY